MDTLNAFVPHRPRPTLLDLDLAKAVLKLIATEIVE